MAQRRQYGPNGEDLTLPPGVNPYARQATIDQLGSGGRVSQQPGRAGAVGDTIGSTAATVAPMIAGAIGKQAGESALKGAFKGPSGPAMGIGIGGEILGGLLKTKEQQPTYGGEFGEYTDQFGRRHEGSGGGVASNAATWGGRGAQIGSIIPGVGTGIGAGIGAVGGALKGAFTKNAPTANTDFRNEDAGAAIGALYQNELGRQASPEEIATHLSNQGSKAGDRWVGQDNLFSTLGNIRNSPEAQAFAARGGVGGPTTGGAEPVARPLGADNVERDALVNQLGAGGITGGQNTGVAGGLGLSIGAVGGDGGTHNLSTATGAQGAIGGGGATSGVVPPGWDADKVAAGHNSPKYAAREGLVALSQQLQGIPDEAGRKAAAEQTLKGMIPKLEAAGGKVLDVKGEKILLDANDGKGPLWIDTIEDIEGKAAPRWGADDASEVGAATGEVAGGGGVPQVDLSGNSNTLQQILEQIRQIQAGTPDRGALLSQMGG